MTFLGWLGMWLSLSLERPALAVGMTMLCGVLLPTLLFCVPGLFINLALISWGWRGLSQDRKLVAEQYQPVA